MLRGELGEGRFWRSIARYVEDNAQRSVETIDLIRAIEAATGRNMRRFFNQWVFREGHPQLEVSIAWDAARRVATLTIDQNQTVDTEHPAYAFDVEIGFAPEATALPVQPAHEPVSGERRVRASVERRHETIAVPLDFEPKLVRFDPGSFLLADVRYRLGADLAAADAGSRSGRHCPHPRRARTCERRRPRRARGHRNRICAGAVLGRACRDRLRHRRDARAMGSYDSYFGARASASKSRPRGGGGVGWVPRARCGDRAHRDRRESRLVFRARGRAGALGKTRDARAFDVLSAAVKKTTWNGTVEAGAVLGLAELADARAMAPIVDASRPERSEGLRRAATTALGRLGALVEEERTRVVDELEERLGDPSFMVALDAIIASESLSDVRLLPGLDRLAQQAVDGRMRRDAMEAAIRIRQAAKIPAQVRGLREDIDELREDQRRLQEKIEALARA